ncbi:MAG: glycosyltransferase family 4 protein [Planctomycetes bacterium]|nr:glycosyltransferase family 4 protein [Planctomycetota bacterium]
MKTAVIIEHFNPARGGAETYTAALVAYLAGKGHEVTLVTEDWSAIPAGVTPVRVPVKGITAARRYLSFSTQASQLVAVADYDIVHSMAPVLWANVFHPHGGVTHASLERSLASSPTTVSRGLRKAARWLNTKKDILLELESIIYTGQTPPRFVAVSEMVASDMKRFYGVDVSRIDVVYNGVDTARFRPENRASLRQGLRAELGIGEDEVVVLLVAHNYRLKGVEIFIKVLAELAESPRKTVRGLIVGAKSGTHGIYPQLARKMGLGDSILFHDAAGDIERFYAAADIYLHPTFYDPMSLVALEALASGLPVVTTRLNGCSEIMTEGVEGFIVDDPRDVAGIVEGVGMLLDPSRRDDAGRAARALAQKFPLERNFEGILEVYGKAAGEGPPPDVLIKRGT